MSQRKFFQNGREVLCGWDRPLQEYFLSVFDPTVPEDVDEGYVLYSTLDDPKFPAHRTDPHFILEKLRTLGFEPPESLYADLRSDQDRDAGNEVHLYA